MDANNSNITPILPAESIDGTAAASIAAAATAYAQFALQAAALVPGQDGQLVLPAGVSLDNIRVVGRDLVIRMPDGSEVVVPDGAVFVPQFVVDGVAVPPVNLAALLIGQEPQPAAGPPQSSGGNFSQVPGDIGDPFGLGDLLPPTELAFPEPEQRELVPGLIDRDPDVNIQDGGPAGKDVTDNVSEVGLPGTRTNGNVESPGSSAGNGSDSTTGTIIVTSPDGIASITINGVVYTGEGQQITTPNGVLTLGALTGDQIPYTYRLTDNTSGNNTTDVFTVVLTDPDGDSSTARLTIIIADDVPTARNDTDSVAGGTYGPETGNVLSGAGTTSGSAGADTLGADGGAISGFRAGSSGSFAAVGTTINGQYGTLTLGANGTYTYVRNTNTPGGVTDVFTYQLTDSDGDASTATLTINIGDAPNRIVFVPEIGEGTQVREPHLPARDGEPSGSQFDGNPESTSGTITFNSPDGVGSVTISGVTITPGALPQQVVSDATGTLVITAYSYDPVTGNGSITYTYTLNDNTLNTSGSTVTLPIVVTDLDGDSANDDLNITIIDDAPLAVNDSAIQETENAPVTVNVFTNDTPGADSVNLSTGVTIVSESLSGAGSLAYNGDGTFTYTPAPGEEGTVTFQYTITDGDGDPSTATVTITLLKDSQPRVDVSGENFVDEAGLPARGSEPEGSNESSDSENTTGTIAISTGGDTLQSLVINGTNVTAGGTVTGAHGTLTVTVSEGAYSYSYTLTDNTSGEGATDSFNVVVTDSDGDSANDTLVIGIHDDAPTAIKDADNIAAGEYGPATGNVITDAEGDGGADTPGADGVTVTAISGFGGAGAVDGTTNGQYGVLTLNADGSYSYARNPGTPGGVSDVFSYTITDGDGDPSTATLTISIDDSKTTLDLPTEGEAGTQVEEAGLPAGSDAGADSELTAGTIAYTAPDGPATVTIDGAAVTAVGQTFTGSFGTLTITSIAPGAIGYEYELTTNTSGDATFDDFAVVVTDQDGDNTPGTLVIDIVDDVPTAREDIDSVTEDAFVDGEGNPQADGNVLTGVGGFDANATDGVGDTEGADGAVVTAVAFDPDTGVDGDEVAGVVNGDTPGEYGSLTLNADGSYTYTLNNFDPRVQGLDSNDTLTETFIYTITDGDGDPSTTTLTITINGSDDRITINGLNVEGPDLIVDEDDLPVRELEPAGSDTTPDSLTQTGSFTVNGLDGIASVKIGGTEAFVGQTITSGYGTFTITSISAPADGNATAITIGYSYVLTDNTAHANAGGENFLTELLDVAVTDTDGSTDTDQVEVRIVDDVPTAKPDGTYSVAEQTALTFDALANDVKGADGVNLVTGVAIATNPSKGTVVYNDDGTFTYTPNAGAEGTDSFTYTITDADGDPSTTTVTLNLLADSIPEIVRVTNLTADEDGFAGANADNGLPGEVTSTNSTSATGTLVASFGADVPTNLLASISLNDSAALDGQLVTLAGLPVTFAKVGNDLVGSADGQEIICISITGAVAGPGASDVTYTYTATLLQPVQHAVPGSEDSDILSAIGFTVTDSEGDPASGSFAVTVVDDLPTLEIGGATASVTEGGAPYNGVWTLDPGADGMTTLSLNVNGTVQSFTLGGAPATFALAQGTLTFRADGTYTFQPSGNLDHDLPQTVTLTVSGADRDGDPVSDSITITINDGSGPIGGDTSTLTVNEAALDTPAATGSDPVLTTEVASDTLAFTAGSDNLVDFRFAGVADLVANIDGAGTDLFWTLSGDGKTIIGALTDGGPAAITIALTAPASIAATTSGTVGVTVTLADNLPHELALAAQTAGLGTVTVVASDQDGDSATGMVTVQVVDDIPDITGNAAAAATLSVDDTTLTTNATANMSSLFTINYNADGPAATGSIAYTLSIAADGTDSGVKDTATGQAVLLTNEAGVIVGRTATGGDIVFTVTVNATTGSVTLDQVRAVVHSPDTGANQFFDLAADLINLTATIKDGDGDIDSETVGISQGMRFFDDGLRGASLSVSNELGVLLTTQDAETIAAASDFAVTTANFSGVFSTSANYGNDLPGTTVLTYALATVGGTPDSGLDSHGAPITLYNIAGVITGSTAASLGAVDATNTIFTIAVGATTGIVTLTQFAEIDHAGPGVDSGFDTQFATLANNLVRLTGTAVYTDGDGDSASLNLFVDLGGNVRFADDGPVLTTTLKDGALLTIDETNGVVAAGTEVDPDATGNLGSATIAIGNLYTSTVVSGADGPATLTYKLIVTDNTPSGYLISSTNESINLFRVSDTVVEGRGAISGNVALTFSIAANGTVTMTQLIAIEHSDTTNHDETSGGMNAGVLLVETTATDFDNDFDKATVDLGSIVRIEDDGPTINVTKGEDVGVSLVTQDAETDGVPTAEDVATSAANFGGVFGLTSAAGADGAVAPSLAYTLNTAGGASGLTSHGVAINLFKIGNVIVGSTSATAPASATAASVVFSVAVSGNGVVTLTQYSQIDHALPGEANGPYDDQFETLLDSAITLTASASVTDGDGDTASDSETVNIGANIRFADDGPVLTNASGNSSVTLDETTAGSPAGFGVAGISQTSAAAIVTATAAFGADGAAVANATTYALSVVGGGVTTLQTAIGNHAISLSLSPDGKTVTGSYNDGSVKTAFTATINANGTLTVTQFVPLEHIVDGAPGAAHDDTLTLSGLINATITITDYDGDTDSETVAIGDRITFKDDGPTLNVTVGSDANAVLITQDADTIGAISDIDTSSANFDGVFGLTSNGGADGAAAPSLAFSLNVTDAVSGLSSNGTAINLYLIAGKVVGSTAANAGAVTAGNTVFDIATSNTGVVTLTQYSQIDHPIGSDPSASATPFDDHVAVLANGKVTLTASSTITDNDGDTASDSETIDLGGNIAFADHGPDVTLTLTGTQIRIDETDGVVATGGEIDPTGGNLGSVTMTAASLFTLTNAVTSADAPTSYAYNFVLPIEGANSGLLLSTTNTAILLYTAAPGVIEGRVGGIGGAVAFTVSVNTTSGAVTVTQNLAVEHLSGGASHDEDSAPLTAGALTLRVTATDFDGDTDTANVDLGSIIRFEDDGPTINVTKGDDAAVVLATQDAETIGGLSDNAASIANFAGVFGLTSTSGADGAATPTLSYALTLAVAAGTNSGLTIGGTAIKLYSVGGVIVGSTALSAPASATDASVVFSLGVNGGGVVTLTQYQQIDHPLSGDPSPTGTPFVDHSVLLANGLVNLTASSTITDNDGDTASDSETIDLGGNVRFDDHGPSVSTTGVVPTLTVDETTLLTDASASFATNFTVNYGADGAGSTVYALGAVSGASGLVDMATGEAVHLRVVGGVVEGYSVTTNQLVFTVTVNGSGSVTLNQLRAVAHTPNTTADQSTGLTGANLVTLTASATDFDGDTAQQTINIGDKLIFKDDGPAIDIAASGTALIVDESLGTTGSTQNEGGRVNEDETLPGAAVGAFGYATGSIVSLVSANAGADGEALRVYSLTVNGTNPPSGLVDAVTNSGIVLVSVNSTTVEGRVGSSGGLLSFRITIDPANGTATINQFRAVEHNDSSNHDENGGSEALMNSGVLSLGVTITDRDNDSANDTVDISQLFKFEDDGPAATGESGATDEVLQDFNTAFVIDFSGSIDNTELNTQLVAVKAAITALFGSTGGNVSVKFVLFATSAMASATFTSAAAANAYLDTVNPTTGGTRPPAIGSSTDFTDAITTLLANYAADETANNQVFFLSDGNPNQPDGLPSGQALMPAVATQWNNFVDQNGINVTAIGVGGGINNSNLQQIDVDGAGAPILVANFDDLIDTLTALFAPAPITGDLDINDDFGTDGGRILSITVPTAAVTDPVYTWNGVTGAGSQITVSGGGATINGTTSFTAATEAGGSLTFNFFTGAWSYTPPRTVPADTTEVFNYTIVDGDGDTATAALSVLVENNELPGTTPVTATVDDDALSGNAGGTGDLDANAGEVPASASEAIHNGTLNITATDNPIAAISFAQLQGTTSAIGLETVAYSWNAVTNLLTATITVSPDANRVGDTLFTVQLNNPSNGSYTVTLVDNVLHSNVAGENDASVALTYRVADTDGSTNSGVLNITFDDDTPRAFYPDTAIAQNGNTAAVTAALVFAASAGADGAGGATFNIVNGTLARDTDGGLLKIGGQQLYLFGNGTGTLTATTSSTGSGGTVGYTINLNPGGDTFTLDVNNTISNGSEISISNLTSAASGNVAIRGVGAGDATNAVDVLLSGRGGTINTSTTGIGVGNQTIDPTEAVRIDLVSNLTADGSGDGFAYTDHVGVASFRQTISQVQGPASNSVAVRVWAIDADNDETYGNTPGSAAEGGETIRTINSVVVIDASSGLSFTFTADGTQGGFTVDFAGNGSVLISGLQTNDQYKIGSASAFDAVVVESATAGQPAFDLGIFSIETITSGNPINLAYNVNATDGDGDAVSGVVKAAILPPGADTLFGDSGNNTVNGNANANAIAGYAGNDTLNGNDGNDTLYGGLGNDALNGGSGLDKLHGGLGLNTMTGGAGNDTFVIDLGSIAESAQVDIITDYAAGDIVDLTQLISVPTGTNVVTGGYVKYLSGSGDIQVDLDGGGNNFVTVATLDTLIPASISVRVLINGVATNVSVNAVAAPVALDLDGDGVEFIPVASGVEFDYDGNGQAENTAWVGADDGILAFDGNGNNRVDNGAEIIFARDGLTDLQGLAADYDSNKDGVLDASDTDFAKFGVWQDANSNGVTDAGEFQSLSDAGIASINLVSDGVEYAAADGDVTVYGTSSFTRADGTTDNVADASFATAGGSKVAANENDQRVLISANAGMAGSMVAAGLVAAVAIEHDAIDAVLSKVGSFDGGHRADGFAALQSAPFEATQASDLFGGLNGPDAGASSFGDHAVKFSSFDRTADIDAFQDDSFGGDRIDAITANLLAPTEIDHGMFNMSNGSSMGMAVDAGSQALIGLQEANFAQSALQNVVADALAGGVGEGANVDALLNALAGPANDMSLLGDSLAQTFGDNPVFEALSFNNANDMIDQLTITHMELSAATGHHG